MSYDSEVLADAPVGYWKLNETSGTSAVDSSGASRNGTYVGGVTLGTKTLLDGAVCADFNGSTGYVNLGAPSAFDFKDIWSIEAWVTTDITGSGEQYILSEGYTTGSQPIYYALAKNIGASGTGKMFAGMFDGAWRTASEATPLATGTTFSHYVATFDGSTIRIYKNGLRTATAIQGPASGTAFSAVAIGTRIDNGAPIATYWDGGIGRVALYHSVLSDARVATHYIAGGGTIPPTVARIYHEYAEAIVQTIPGVRTHHEYAEVVLRMQSDVRLFHQFAEVIMQGGSPVRNYHQFAEVILGPYTDTSTLMELG